MTKLGRNDPCWCGSGKKYKQCHLAADEGTAGAQRRLQLAGDTLLPRIIEHAQSHVASIPGAFARYWNGAYTPDQMSELDGLEGRGAERFLTWFAFDYPLDTGQTLVETLATGQADFTLGDDEAQVLAGWLRTRLRAYIVDGATKGKDLTVHDITGGQVYTIDDQAASRFVAPGEVLVVHLLPVGTRFFVGGAAAHLTADTAEKLHAFIDVHLEGYRRDHPDAGYDELLWARSELLNHFVMALPVEAPDPAIFDTILRQAREALQLDNVADAPEGNTAK